MYAFTISVRGSQERIKSERLEASQRRSTGEFGVVRGAGKMTLAGFEPAIFGSEDQRLIH